MTSNKCTKCGSKNCVKADFKKTVEGNIQRYKCKKCNRQFTGQERFHKKTQATPRKEIDIAIKRMKELTKIMNFSVKWQEL